MAQQNSRKSEDIHETSHVPDIEAVEQDGEEPKAEQNAIEDASAEPTATETLRNEAEEYKTKYLRAVADYRNLERRVMDERKELIPTIKANTVEAFFPIMDNLDKAEMFIKDPGLKMIKDQFVQTMQELGVREVELMGKPFDPHTAEAIEVVDGENDGIIVEVTRKAYKLGDRIIQHGQVKVSKKKVN
jgi:molecular chaperone GrpE